MASDIRPGVPMQMFAELSGVPGRQFPVSIKEISQTADPTTQTFQVRLTMKGTRGVTALPGMTASVIAKFRGTGNLARRILVPVSAVVQPEGAEQIVWIVGPDESARRRPVKAGATTGDRIEILSGLRPGDRVVTAGAAFVRDGMKVRELGAALGDSMP